MKDDFYKDMEHTRRDQKQKPDSRRRKRTKVDPELSRSARYKEEDKKHKKEQQKKQSSNKNSSKKSVKNTPTKRMTNKKTEKQSNDKKATSASIASLANNAKKYLLTTREKYQKQLGSEIGESKNKLKSLREAAFTGLKSQRNNKKWKAVLLLILTPIAILFAFMIISNFWPSGEDYKTDPNETADVEAVDKRQINKEFEKKKAELEKEFAGRDENKSDDTDETSSNTDSAAREYTEEEQASMKKEADKVIEEKKDKGTESESDYTDEIDETEESDESDEDTTDKDNEVGATHTVTSTDNLYRIAIQYYGSGSEENLEKIREANGISGNNLSLGQELIIP